MRRGTLLPGKRPVRIGLAVAVDRDGAMRGGAAKVVAPHRFGRVTVRARIDQVGVAERPALNAEQIGMTVAAAVRTTDRTDVEHEVMWIDRSRSAHDDVSTVAEDARLLRERSGLAITGVAALKVGASRRKPEHFRC